MEKFDKKIKKLKSFLPKVLVADRMAAAREIERLTRKTPKPLPVDQLRAKGVKAGRGQNTARCAHGQSSTEVTRIAQDPVVQ